MSNDHRDLLSLLRKELEFLEKGGYRYTARAPWRPHFIFQDSPSCLNFDPTQKTRPCAECALTQLVPEQLHGRNIPCRYIPLNDKGVAIDSFYRSGTQRELEAAFGQWLKGTIRRMEPGKEGGQNAEVAPEIHVEASMDIE